MAQVSACSSDDWNWLCDLAGFDHPHYGDEDEDDWDDEEVDFDDECTWDVDAISWPVAVWPGQAVLGEITFDGDCNLIVGGGEELPHAEGLYRVGKNDGSVSVLVAAQDLPLDSLAVSGLTYRASDQRIYFTANIADAPADMLLAVDEHDQLHPVLELEKFTYSQAGARCVIFAEGA